MRRGTCTLIKKSSESASESESYKARFYDFMAGGGPARHPGKLVKRALCGTAGRSSQKTAGNPPTNVIVADSSVPGVMSAAVPMREMVEGECNFRQARKLFSLVSS